jgi:hypothetical protein
VTFVEGNILYSLQFETWSKLTIRKSPFPSNDNKAKGVLNIVHSDVCGALIATSLSVLEYKVEW